MLSLLSPGSFGWMEILLVVGILILLFGAKKIPELFRGFGQGIREFRNGMRDGAKEG